MDSMERVYLPLSQRAQKYHFHSSLGQSADIKSAGQGVGQPQEGQAEAP